VPPNLDVKSSTSQPITVRSKRARGKRKKESPSVDSDSLTAIASWCRFAKDIMTEMSSQEESCPSCHFIEPRHAPKCKLNRCLLGYKHIQSLLESKSNFQEPKRQKAVLPKFNSPVTPLLDTPSLDTPPRFPMFDLKRDRSPKLSLENIHNIIPMAAEQPSNTLDEFLCQPPKLIKQPVLQRKKSG